MVKSKDNKNIGAIQKIKNNLPSNTLQLLYYILIHPYFNYCNITWACRDNVHTQSLYRLQQKAIHLVTLASWNSHSAPIFKRQNILNVFDINKLQVRCIQVYLYLYISILVLYKYICIQVYKYLTGLLLLSFADYYIIKSSIHMIKTRNSHDLYLPSHRTNIRENSIRIRGVKVWNVIPVEIRNKISINSFCNKYKTFLIQMYN